MQTAPNLETTLACVALGANIGACERTIASALDALAQLSGTTLIAVAPVIRTTPVDAPENSPDFLNTVAVLRTPITPLALLDQLMRIEREHRRDRAREAFHGPRTLDLDLILYGDLVMQTDRLTLPHPRMHTRAFVLEPLCAIAPHAVHPTLGLTAQALLNRLKET